MYYPAPEPVLFQIGDISVTQSYVIVPQGVFPLRGTVWAVHDSTQVTEGISTAGVVLAVVFVWFCLLGLLFLLMKERRYIGFVSISVTGEGLYHTVQLPAGPQAGAWAAHMVGQARGLAAVAPPV